MKVNFKHTLYTHNPKSAEIILPYVFNIVNPKSVLDIGCGTGSWLKASKDFGVNEIFGVDGILVSSDELMIKESEFLKHDLSKNLELGKKYDMIISLEVAEHLPESAAENFVDTLTKHSNVIFFSAAIPNQGGQQHINEQWPNYWNEKFKQRGFQAFDILRNEFWENEKVHWWYKQNMLFFVKEEEKSFAGFQPSTSVLPYVHPSLYQKKIFKPQFLNSRKQLLKTSLRGLKYLFKK